MKARLLLPLVLAQLAVAACGGPSAPPIPAGPVTIGLITSLTGVDLPLGVDVALGARQAIAEAGGVDGHPLKLVEEDDGSTGPGAAAAFAALSARHVAGVVGPVGPASAAAVAAAASRRHTPVLPAWGGDGLARGSVFLAAPPAGRAAERMLAFARSGRLQSLAVAHPTGDPYADAGVAALKAEAHRYGARVIADLPFSPDTTDFTALIDSVRSSGADLLLAWGGGASTILLERAWKPSGLQAPLLLSPASATQDFISAASYSGDGARLVTTESVLAPALPSTSPARRQVDPFAAAFTRANGYYPSQAAFDGYAAVRLLLAAIAAAGSLDPRAVDAALASLRLSTAAGDYAYSGGDHLGLAAGWLAVATLRGGKLTP